MASILPMSPLAPRIESGAAVSLRRLEKGFAGRQVLRALSLEIARGMFVAIVGRSGCGKTTLLRIVAGLERYDGGDLTISRGSLSPSQHGRPDVRLMFQ